MKTNHMQYILGLGRPPKPIIQLQLSFWHQCVLGRSYGLLMDSSSYFLSGSERGTGAEMGKPTGTCYCKAACTKQRGRQSFPPTVSTLCSNSVCSYVFGLWQKESLQGFSGISGSWTLERLLCSVREQWLSESLGTCCSYLGPYSSCFIRVEMKPAVLSVLINRNSIGSPPSPKPAYSSTRWLSFVTVNITFLSFLSSLLWGIEIQVQRYP